MRTLLILIFLLPVVAFSSQDRGGGDGVLNHGKWSLLDLVERYDAKYYFPHSEPYFNSEFVDRFALLANKCAIIFRHSIKNQKNFIDAATSPSRQVKDRRLVFPIDSYGDPRIMNKTLPDGGTFMGVEEIYGDIAAEELTWLFTDRELDEIKDEGHIKLPSWERKQQIAIQQKGIVLIHRPLFEKLDDKNKAALILHEILLSVALQGGAGHLRIYGTVHIRSLIHSLFTVEHFAALPFSAFESFCGWGGSAFKDLQFYQAVDPSGFKLPIYRIRVAKK